jgi:hypothetical protein
VQTYSKTSLFGIIEVAQFLVARGADLNAIDDDGNTPVDKALSPVRSLQRGMGMPEYPGNADKGIPGDAEKRRLKRAVAEYLRQLGAQGRKPEIASSIDPRVRDELEAIIPGLVFNVAHIYLRGKGPDIIVPAVESKLDCRFMEGMPSEKREEIRREIRNMILSEYERGTRP